MAAPGLAIRADVASAPELRRRAKKEPRRRTAQRMLALAKAMEGMSRAEAARAAGIERQALRDAVLRFNAEGLAGLVDRPYGRRPERQVECRMTDSLRASATRAFPGPDRLAMDRYHPVRTRTVAELLVKQGGIATPPQAGPRSDGRPRSGPQPVGDERRQHRQGCER